MPLGREFGFARPEPGHVPDDVVVGQHPGGGRADGVAGHERLGHHAAQRRGVPRRGEEREVEGLVHLVRAHVPGQPGQRLDPRLGDHAAVARVLLEDPAPGAVDLVHAVLVEHRATRPGTAACAGARVAVLRGGRGVGAARGGRLLGALDHRDDAVPVGQAGLLDHAVRDVDPEAVDAPVQPEPQHVLELAADLGVLPVEVRLLGVEQVQVPLAVRDAGPRGPAEDRQPVVRRQLAGDAAALAEQVAVALGAARGGVERGPEPDVLVGGVVRDEVDDDAHAELVRALEQAVGVGERAEQRVDVAVVGDVVAGVGLRRGVEGREPDGVHAERRRGGPAAR